MVVFCPNLGVLSAVVLSLVPMLLPFAWQCLLLPVLPAAPEQLELVEVRAFLPSPRLCVLACLLCLPAEEQAVKAEARGG